MLFLIYMLFHYKVRKALNECVLYLFLVCDDLNELENRCFFHPQQNVTQPVDMEVSV